MNTNSASTTIVNAIVIALAIIGFITVITLIGMITMHGSMRGMMNSANMGNWMAAMCNVGSSP